ncbi:MAG: hypothetical protein R2991_12055 [Thermoanaerobaculia bacterium]
MRSSEKLIDPHRCRGRAARGWRRYQKQLHDPEPLGPWVTLDRGEEVYVLRQPRAHRLGFCDGVGGGCCGPAFEEIDPQVEPWTTCRARRARRTWWTDGVARRFRYVYVLGVDT